MRQHTSAFVSIRQHTPSATSLACGCLHKREGVCCVRRRSLEHVFQRRQLQVLLGYLKLRKVAYMRTLSIRQNTSAYVSIRQLQVLLGYLKLRKVVYMRTRASVSHKRALNEPSYVRAYRCGHSA